jgi:hypothetical protein
VPRPLTPAEELDIALLLGYPADYYNENPIFYGAIQRINDADHLYDKVIHTTQQSDNLVFRCRFYK